MEFAHFQGLNENEAKETVWLELLSKSTFQIWQRAVTGSKQCPSAGKGMPIFDPKAACCACQVGSLGTHWAMLGPQVRLEISFGI